MEAETFPAKSRTGARLKVLDVAYDLHLKFLAIWVWKQVISATEALAAAAIGHAVKEARGCQ